MNSADTIAAVSTPPGRGGIGIVRLSGSRALEIAASAISLKSELRPWASTMGELRDDDGELVDEAVVAYFAAPKSYTAEDVVEISCHGSPVILRYCLERCLRAGARLAEPGEFTMRAWLHGRIDLPQAEAVRDLIESATLYQAKVAARQARGSISQRLAPLKAQLVELIALLEAGIDFAEDDISVAPQAEILRRLDPVIEGVENTIRSFSYGRLVHDGFSLAIVGRPNAGKSSLFNRLVGEERAIVTEIPGTTRDLISEIADFAGIPVRLLDTAGIRDTGELVERLGIERSFQAMADADLTIVVIDGSLPRSAEDEDLIRRARTQGNCLVAASKSDLAGFRVNPGELAVSSMDGNGIENLRNTAIDALAPEGSMPPDSGFITSARHEELLREALKMLLKTREAVTNSLPHELLLLDLYCSLQPLDAITGATTADDILHRIFATFCIGK